MVSAGTSIAVITPATGDGISVSTLSVETSRSGSSIAIESPTFFSQRVTVPSVTDSPKAGMVTTAPFPFAFAAGAAATGATGATGGTGVTGGATGSGVAATGGATGVAAEPSALMIANSVPTATV